MVDVIEIGPGQRANQDADHNSRIADVGSSPPGDENHNFFTTTMIFSSHELHYEHMGEATKKNRLRDACAPSPKRFSYIITGLTRQTAFYGCEYRFLFMIEFIGLILRRTGQPQPQPGTGACIHRGQNNRGVGLAPPQGRQLLQSPGRQSIAGGRNSQGD